MEVKWEIFVKKDLRVLLVVDGASSRTDEVECVGAHDQNENEDQRQRHDPAKQNQEQDPADEEQDGHDGAGFVRLVPVAGGWHWRRAVQASPSTVGQWGCQR